MQLRSYVAMPRKFFVSRNLQRRSNSTKSKMVNLKISLRTVFYFVALHFCAHHYNTPSGLSENKTESFQGVHRQGDGCFHVFLDVGANIGVHGRFLFEPENYPKARIAKSIFDGEFGSDRDNRDICSFEFEPNPAHRSRLEAKSSAYRAMGWRYEYIRAAAGDFDGYIDFHHNNDSINEEWGFSVKNLVDGDAVREKVPVLRLSSWIKHHVTERRIPSLPFGANRTPSVVMKMDIEGSEYVVLPDLILNGALCGVDFLFGEFHPWFVPLNFTGHRIKLERRQDAAHLQNVLIDVIPSSRNCKTRFKYLDDESYLHDGIPLPSGS